MSGRSVLVASNYNAWPEAFNSQAFAFLNVIRAVEHADLIAPEAEAYTKGRALRPTFHYLGAELGYRSYSQLRRYLGLTRYSPMQSVSVDRNYDVFFYMCQFPIDLSSLNRIKNWRSRSKLAIAFILEPWTHQMRSAKAELRLLDEFDHVFVFNRTAVQRLADYTRAPASYLAAATDCLLATPLPDIPPRSIDVYSMGRRSPATHKQLTELARSGNDFHYVFDASRHGSTTDWADSRLLTSSFIKRAKFFVAYDHTVVDTGGIAKDFPERSLSTRYFEGAAGGAVMIGSSPDCAEWHEYFDWEDALIEIPIAPSNIAEVLANLNAQPERLRRARTNNIVQSLLRHDWAHRWAEILNRIGLPRTRALDDRLARLASLAAMAEARRELVA